MSVKMEKLLKEHPEYSDEYDIFMRDCTIGEVRDAVIKVNFMYEDGDIGQYTPVVRNLNIRNITSKKSVYAVFLEGYARSPISDVTLVDCSFMGVAKENHLNHSKNLIIKNTRINGKLYADK